MLNFFTSPEFRFINFLTFPISFPTANQGGPESHGRLLVRQGFLRRGHSAHSQTGAKRHLGCLLECHDAVGGPTGDAARSVEGACV